MGSGIDPLKIHSRKFRRFRRRTPVMRMLAEQAENNVIRAVKEADMPGAVTKEEYLDEIEDEYGAIHKITETYYSCGSCTGHDYDDVKSDYKHLITQLTRRAAFLTIFGLFDHRMSECYRLMMSLSGDTEESKRPITIDDCHKILTSTMGGKDIVDVSHLAIIRNIMAHSDGIAVNYKESLSRNGTKSGPEKKRLKAIRRAENENAGISVNCFDNVVMHDGFLLYAVGDIARYINSVDSAVQAYYRDKIWCS